MASRKGLLGQMDSYPAHEQNDENSRPNGDVHSPKPSKHKSQASRAMSPYDFRRTRSTTPQVAEEHGPFEATLPSNSPSRLGGAPKNNSATTTEAIEDGSPSVLSTQRPATVIAGALPKFRRLNISAPSELPGSPSFRKHSLHSNDVQDAHQGSAELPPSGKSSTSGYQSSRQTRSNPDALKQNEAFTAGQTPPTAKGMSKNNSGKKEKDSNGHLSASQQKGASADVNKKKKKGSRQIESNISDIDSGNDSLHETDPESVGKRKRGRSRKASNEEDITKQHVPATPKSAKRPSSRPTGRAKLAAPVTNARGRNAAASKFRSATHFFSSLFFSFQTEISGINMSVHSSFCPPVVPHFFLVRLHTDFTVLSCLY